MLANDELKNKGEEASSFLAVIPCATKKKRGDEKRPMKKNIIFLKRKKTGCRYYWHGHEQK